MGYAIRGGIWQRVKQFEIAGLGKAVQWYDTYRFTGPNKKFLIEIGGNITCIRIQESLSMFTIRTLYPFAVLRTLCNVTVLFW